MFGNNNNQNKEFTPRVYNNLEEVKVQAGKYARKEFPMVQKTFQALSPEITDEQIMTFMVSEKMKVILESIENAKTRNEIPQVEIKFDEALAARVFA